MLIQNKKYLINDNENYLLVLYKIDCSYMFYFKNRVS